MKKLTVLIIIILSSLFILISCQPDYLANNNNSNEYLDESIDQHVTLLFSKDDRVYDEHNYYDALLDFRRAHPDHLKTIDVVNSNEKDIISSFNIEVFPTLLIVKDLDVLVRVEGLQDSSHIYQLLETTLVK